MPQEDVPTIQNKKLLVIALALAVVVVAVYHVQIARVRRAGQAEQVTLLRFRSDMAAGDRIGARDVEPVPVPVSVVDLLPGAVKVSEFEEGRSLYKPVKRGDLLQWGHTIQRADDSPAAEIRKGQYSVVLPIDPNYAPGQRLRVGDRVNVLGRLPDENGQVRTFRIVEALKVMAIGGVVPDDAAYSAGRDRFASTPRSFRSIEVEVDPETSLELYDVLDVVGSVMLEVRNPAEPLGQRPGRVDAKVLQLIRRRPPPAAKAP